MSASHQRGEKGSEWGRDRREDKSRAAGDGGGNHGYKDGGQREQQDDLVQEEDGLPAVAAVV